ncbi:uncharacterized protein [Neodiprion pinetum]|uniref:uncharacterized protein n=1 Tax=Neodiprion pinetum TaxID=441929 RepID=UPI00371F77C8
MDIQQKCRLCFFKVHKPQNIFTTSGLLNKIRKFTDIQVKRGDGLPSSVCDLCVMKLKIADKFRRQVGRTDKLIRAFVSSHAGSQRYSSKNKSMPNLRKFGTSNSFHDSQDLVRSNYRHRVCRERMHTSRNMSSFRWRDGSSGRKSRSVVRRGESDLDRSFIYSSSTARSLTASYTTLTNRCRAEENPEDFSLPSSFASVFDSNERQDNGAKRTRGFRIVRHRQRERRLLKKRQVRGEESLKSTSRNVINYQLASSGQHALQQSCGLPSDPLNLLKVKKVRPLLDRNDDDDDSAASSVSTGRSSPSWRYDGKARLARDFQTRFSSPSSAGSNFSDEFFDPITPENAVPQKRYFYQRTRVVSETRLASANVHTIDVGRAQGDGPVPTTDNSKIPVNCPLCKKICASLHGFKIHVRMHASEKCRLCEASTESKEKFRKHMVSHVESSESKPQFQCRCCKRVLKTKAGLSIHVRIHSKSVPAAIGV